MQRSHLMNADGSNQTVLASDLLTYYSNASWSPDGSMVAFDAYVDFNREIFVVSSDGSNLHRLTHNSGDDVFPFWGPIIK